MQRRGGRRRKKTRGGEKRTLASGRAWVCRPSLCKMLFRWSIARAEAGAATSLLGKAVGAGHLRGVCLKETAMGAIEKLMSSFRALVKDGHSALTKMGYLEGERFGVWGGFFFLSWSWTLLSCCPPGTARLMVG